MKIRWELFNKQEEFSLLFFYFLLLYIYIYTDRSIGLESRVFPIIQESKVES